MSLKDKSFEDFIYTIESRIKDIKQLPIDLSLTNTSYLKQLFYLFNSIDDDKISLFKYNKDSGFTTGLLFIAMYYTFSKYNVTIIAVNKTAMTSKLKMISKFMQNIYPEINFIETEPNEFQSDTLNNSCELNVIGYNSYNIADLKGVVLFDCNTVISNTNKFEDVINNMNTYDKIIMNFKVDDYLTNLAKEKNTEILDIKLK